MATERAIDIAPCAIGEYREMEEEIVRSEGDEGENSYLLEETGRIKRCVACPQGKYSVTQGVTSCKKCPVGAECPGGRSLIPKEGYWKSETFSGDHYKCNLDGCEGDL